MFGVWFRAGISGHATIPTHFSNPWNRIYFDGCKAADDLPVSSYKIKNSLICRSTPHSSTWCIANAQNSFATILAIVHRTVNCVFDSLCLKMRICLIQCIFWCQILEQLLLHLLIFENCIFLKIEMSVST